MKFISLISAESLVTKYFSAVYIFVLLWHRCRSVRSLSPLRKGYRFGGGGRGAGGRTVVRFFVRGDLRHNIKPSFDRRHMSEGTRHFISREWLPTMRTLPIDREPGIFLYSSSIKDRDDNMAESEIPRRNAQPSCSISMTKVSLFPN